MTHDHQPLSYYGLAGLSMVFFIYDLLYDIAEDLTGDELMMVC